MAGNTKLRKADRAKYDEFYTRLSDIEDEMRYYKEQFKGKTVLCNCDDPYKSNFFKYFAWNFNYLGLKKLIATSYDNSPTVNTRLSFTGNDKTAPNNDRRACKIEITEVDDYNGDGAADLSDVEYLLKNKKNTFSLLKGNGDFRSEECTELLRQADIVATNPPFSVFREYVSLITDYNKDFIIIGNTNALTYKDVFRLFKENRIRTGNTKFNVGMYFYVPDDCERYHAIKDGKKTVRVSASCWFTSLEVRKHHEFLTCTKRYSPEEYPKYDNYDAINVNRYTEIPYDYDGLMGVPITFIAKYNPDQFEIIDGIGRYSILNNEETKKAGKYLSMINGKAIYFRCVIRNKNFEKSSED